LIPELVGRLPVLAMLGTLDESALKRILVEPKHAVVKQYTRFFTRAAFRRFDAASLYRIMELMIAAAKGARIHTFILLSILTDPGAATGEVASWLDRKHAANRMQDQIILPRTITFA
jgi:ATP-dependent Clp protease ATP-binding subunit ClpX